MKKERRDAPTLMTQGEFAAHRGVVKSAVSNWKSRGLLVFAERAGQILVDVARTDARLNATIDPTRGRPSIGGADRSQASEPADKPGESLGEVRTDLLREQKIGHKLRNAREAGELVAKAEYEARVAELGRLCRERVNFVIRALAERLAAETDPRVVVSLLIGEVDQAFAELADEAEAGTLGGSEDETSLDAESGEA